MSQSTLLLDVGNSFAKWIFVDGESVFRQGRAALDALPDAVEADLGDAAVLISSVASQEQEEALANRLRECGCSIWFAGSRASLDGLINSYAEPGRMGTDRWLAMLGARQRATGRLCVVDAGSALTIDLVDSEGRHEGGYIIPGAALMARTLLSDTGRVRYDSAVVPTVVPGRSTAEAVGHGVLLAQVGAVKLALEKAAEQGEAPELFLCGGGAPQLQVAIGGSGVFAPNLVFQGLLRQAELENPQMLDFPAIIRAVGASSD